MKPSALVFLLVLAVGALAWFWKGPGSDGDEEPSPDTTSEQGEGDGEPRGAILLGPERHPGDSSDGGQAGLTNTEPSGDEPERRGDPTPAPRSSTAALKLMDRYHREPVAGRGAVRRDADAEMAAALADFEQLWGGGARLYQQQLQGEVPTSLGAGFAGFATAYARGGLIELDRALQRDAQRGPAWKLWAEALVERGLKEQQDERAGKMLGQLLRSMMEDGYAWERVSEFQEEASDLMLRCSGFLPAIDYTVQRGDSLIAIAARHRNQGTLVYWGWIQKFNGKASERISIDERLRIPTVPLHLEMWREARVGALFAGDVPLRIYRVSMGKDGANSETPVGVFTIAEHEPEPVWYKPDGGVVPYGNPENALGERWLGFEEKTSYGLHGTNDESTIGSFETQGCIRFFNDEIVELYDLVPDGTKVTIRP